MSDMPEDRDWASSETAVRDVDQRNERTVVAEVVRLPIGFRDAFLAAHQALVAHAAEMASPGIVVAAVDHAGVAGTIGARCHPDRPAAAIVGRHSEAHLSLAGDRGLALRHLAILVEPSAEGVVRFRVIDLRSGTGFIDEAGRRLVAAVADGPLLLRVAGYVLVILPTPLGSPEASASVAWDGLPPRKFVDATDPSEPIPVRRDPRPGGAWPRPVGTYVSRVQGPSEIVDMMVLAAGERAAGALVLSDGKVTENLELGWLALSSGVLLGRYERCATSASRLFRAERLSRVHSMVVEIGGGVYLIDTASTNRTTVNDEDVGVVRLDAEPAPEVSLADAVVVRWQRAGGGKAQG